MAWSVGALGVPDLVGAPMPQESAGPMVYNVHMAPVSVGTMTLASVPVLSAPWLTALVMGMLSLPELAPVSYLQNAWPAPLTRSEL